MQMQSGSILMLGNGNSYSAVQPILPAGTSGIIAISGARFRFGVGLLLTFQTGVTATNVSVLVSGDKADGAPGIVNWNLHDVLNNITNSASQNSNLAYPVTAVALQIAGFSNVGNTSNGIVLSAVQVIG